MPTAQLQIILLPMIHFSAANGLKGLIAIDTCGLVAGWKYLDHAAHLGGVLFGVFWFYSGNELIWGKRETVMKWWHKNVRAEDGENKVRWKRERRRTPSLPPPAEEE
jgi:rhomboid-like protein